MSNEKFNSSQKKRVVRKIAGVKVKNQSSLAKNVLLKDNSPAGFGDDLTVSEVTKNLVSLFNGHVLTDRELGIVNQFSSQNNTNSSVLQNVILSYIRPSSWARLVTVTNATNILRFASKSQVEQLNENVLASAPFVDVAVKVGVLMGVAGVASRVLLSTLLYEGYPVPLELRSVLISRLDDLVDTAVVDAINEI